MIYTAFVNTPLDRTVVKPGPGAEHHLVAAVPIAAGEPVLVEAPLVDVRLKNHYEFGAYSWDLVDRLLDDRELLQRYNRCRLLASTFLLDPHDLAAEAALVRKHKKSRQLVRELFFNVGTNNIGVLDSQRAVVGYAVYEKLSRADHSCLPNAYLQPADALKAMSSLLAHRDIRAGEAITWSYFREDEFLGASYEQRNFGLVNVFRFVCRCVRCQQEQPAHIRQLKSTAEKVAYFDQLIEAEALELARTPGGLAQVLASSPMALHRAELRKRSG